MEDERRVGKMEEVEGVSRRRRRREKKKTESLHGGVGGSEEKEEEEEELVWMGEQEQEKGKNKLAEALRKRRLIWQRERERERERERHTHRQTDRLKILTRNAMFYCYSTFPLFHTSHSSHVTPVAQSISTVVFIGWRSVPKSHGSVSAHSST